MMRYSLTAAAIVALMSAPATPVFSQDSAGRTSGSDLSSLIFGLNSLITTHRVVFGVVFGDGPRSTDSVGAYIVAVTPGGPAQKAGMKSDVVLTKIAGQSLAARGETLPRIHFTRIISRLKAGSEVSVEVLEKDGRRRTYKVVPTAPETATLNWQLPPASVLSLTGAVQLALADLKLTALNPSLGEYFGTMKGVLVLHTPSQATKLGLKGGDVVQAVDGRRVSTPDDLMRVLMKINEGQPFKFEVMRHRKALTIAAQF